MDPALPTTTTVDRVLNSALTHTTTLLALTVTLGTIDVALCAIAFAVLTLYFIEFNRDIAYECKVIRNLLANYMDSDEHRWYHEIVPNLYLGGMPQATENHLQMMRDDGIDTVVAVCEDWERSYITCVSEPFDWRRYRQLGIEYQFYETVDHSAPSVEQLRRITQYVQRKIREGHKVYIHCKSGRGRSSATVAACLLVLGHSLDTVIPFIQGKRCEACFNEAQRNIIRSFSQTLTK